jgi:hypothetical protein
MTERPPLSPTRRAQPGSAPPSPLRSPRPLLIPRAAGETSPSPPTSQQTDPQVRETGLIAWIESIREDLRRENEVFRENMLRQNEIWKAGVERELREDLRRLVVEKFIADNKPNSSSETSSLNIPEEQRHTPTTSLLSGEPSPVSPLLPSPNISTSQAGESSAAGPSVMHPPHVPDILKQTGKAPILVPTATIARRLQKLPTASPTPFVLPRRPRIGSYYAVIVDTDGDDPDGALLAHMIEIATYRPGFLYSHTGTPEPHRDCCATLYFATIGNVHDWMHDVNNAYRLDTQEIERLEQNSGELKRKRRFDMYVRICKVEAEDPWEIFERRRPGVV